MKFLLLVFTVFSILQAQSIYPLPFTFKDSGYQVNHILHMEGKTRTFGLRDHNDNFLYIRDSIMLLPQCSAHDSLSQIVEISKGKSNTPCQQFFHLYHTNIIKKIVTTDFVILVFQNGKMNEEQISIVFYNNKVIGEIGFISNNGDFGKFYELLSTLKKNKNSISINYYKNNIVNDISKMHINKALINLVSLQLLSYDNKKLEPMLKKITHMQKIPLEINELYIKE